jgi:hypothetical protein
MNIKHTIAATTIIIAAAALGTAALTQTPTETDDGAYAEQYNVVDLEEVPAGWKMDEPGWQL